MKEIKMCFKNDLFLLSFVFFRVLFCCALFVLEDFLDLSISYYFYVGLIVILILPNLYLHLKYQLNDNGKKVLISDDRLLLVSKEGQEINLTEAQKVIFHCHVGLTRPNIPFLINPDYYNIVFIMPDGQVFSVSSLLDRKLKNYIYERISKDVINYEHYMLY